MLTLTAQPGKLDEILPGGDELSCRTPGVEASAPLKKNCRAVSRLIEITDKCIHTSCSSAATIFKARLVLGRWFYSPSKQQPVETNVNF